MQGLLEDPPRDKPDAILASISAGDRESIREAARTGQFDDLRSAAFNKMWYITDRYCNIGDSIDSLEPTLRTLWFIYYQGGKYISNESAEHDRLVLDVSRLRGKGPLTRPARSQHGIDVARTPVGALWNDLPFFVTDMTDYWVNNYATMAADQRLNFASFLAKLASTRLDNDKLCQIALLVFRDALETERPFGSDKELTDANPGRAIHDLSIAEMLPSVCAWIRDAGYNILLMSEVSWKDCPDSIGQGGITFTASELGQKATVGFSPQRYIYWLKRLRQIFDETQQAGYRELEDYATEAIQIIVANLQERGWKILEVFEAAGQPIRQDSDLEPLMLLLEDREL